ncbi:pilin [Erysipelotrichaceae bacterium Oil+RF-744-GAM-WT-6]|uniref:Pilin n=2 Tax=Stecheria intestinalis TaxID=2606630 RepID=A0A7X2NUA7_9FIRM|nr:pilin [Stecheria intestinalis]
MRSFSAILRTCGRYYERGVMHSMKKNKNGFTLAELLIVVAIIGVLVAISIPIFNNQLRKARLATNQANARAAYAAAIAEYISLGEPQPASKWGFSYDVSTGKVTAYEDYTKNKPSDGFGPAIWKPEYLNIESWKDIAFDEKQYSSFYNKVKTTWTFVLNNDGSISVIYYKP